MSLIRFFATTAAALFLSAAPQAACQDCGTVVDVKTVKQKGEGSGVGLVAGGVLGGVLGHQVGGGSGKKIATVAGAAGGAYVGHQAEKNANSKTVYQVVVELDNGTSRTFSYSNEVGYRAGDKVKIVKGKLLRQ